MELSQNYEVVDPGCGCASFAVPATRLRRWKEEHIGWYCPHCGAARVFKQRSEKEEKIADLSRRLMSAQGQIARERERAREKTRQYNRMRKRVQNGVCPCCNRTFSNLARHMAQKHPELPPTEAVRHLRHTFGLTQADLARELYIPTNAVSRFETGRSVGEWLTEQIEGWVRLQLDQAS